MHCSFCHIVGHTIRQCNSPQIEDEYNDIRRFYEDACLDTNSGFGLFLNFVDINFTEISVKAIAFKYIGATIEEAVSSKQRLIERLWIYISSSVSWTIDRTGLTGEEEQPLPLYELLGSRPNPTNLMRYFDSVVSSIPKYDMTISLEEEDCKEEKEDCGICYELTNELDTVHLNCGHKFCGQCMKGCLNVGKIACPMCRCPIANMKVKNVETYDLVSEYCK